MRDHRHSEPSPLPDAARDGSPIAAGFAVVLLLVAGLVAVSYPAVAVAALAGALTAPAARRAVDAVRAAHTRQNAEGARRPRTGRQARIE